MIEPSETGSVKFVAFVEIKTFKWPNAYEDIFVLQDVDQFILGCAGVMTLGTKR